MNKPRIDWFEILLKCQSRFPDNSKAAWFCREQQYSFQGAKYDDVIIIDDSNSQIRVKSPYNCEYFIWSKSKGLLQYKYLNGEVYTFYKKLPNKK